jgi:DNA processing protein
VESTAEVVAALGPAAADLAVALRGRLQALPEGAVSGSAAGQAPGDPDHNRLWSALGHDPTGMDTLVARTGLTVAALSSMLVLMELDGRVVADNGRYSRRS